MTSGDRFVGKRPGSPDRRSRVGRARCANKKGKLMRESILWRRIRAGAAAWALGAAAADPALGVDLVAGGA